MMIDLIQKSEQQRMEDMGEKNTQKIEQELIQILWYRDKFNTLESRTKPWEYVYNFVPSCALRCKRIMEL